MRKRTIEYYYNGAISKATKILGTKIVKAIAIGKSCVHITSINWSYLIRGKEALAQIKVKIIIQAFPPITKPPTNVPIVVL